MSTRIWQGKEIKNKTVGPGKHYDYTTIQAALDAIDALGDSAADNMYCITVAPGVYETAIDHNVSHTILSSEVPYAAVLQKTGDGGGGAYRIGTDFARVVSNVWVIGMTINNQLTGGFGAAGSPPEGALYVGDEANYDTDANWDCIHLISNRIEGSHDGLQVFGHDLATEPGRLFIRGNYIASCHDAFTVKGSIRGVSNANQIHCVASGDLDLLPSANGWKTTGMHFRSDLVSQVSPFGFFDSVGDQIWMDIDGDVGGSNDQDRCTGVLAYNPLTTAQNQLHFTNMRIRIDYGQDHSPSNSLSCVQLDDANSQTMEFKNLKARLHQRGTGGSAPATVYGARVMNASALSKLRFVDAEFFLQNDAGGGTTVCFDAEANGEIEYSNIIHNAATAQAGAGTFTKLTPMA